MAFKIFTNIAVASGIGLHSLQWPGVLNLTIFAKSCHRSPRVSKVTRGVGLRLSIFDCDINRHNLYIIGVDSTMWIHRRLMWLRRVVNDPIWVVSATRPVVPSNWRFEVSQTVVSATCAPAHWAIQCRRWLIVYDNLFSFCWKKTGLPKLWLAHTQ